MSCIEGGKCWMHVSGDIRLVAGKRDNRNERLFLFNCKRIPFLFIHLIHLYCRKSRLVIVDI